MDPAGVELGQDHLVLAGVHVGFGEQRVAGARSATRRSGRGCATGRGARSRRGHRSTTGRGGGRRARTRARRGCLRSGSWGGCRTRACRRSRAARRGGLSRIATKSTERPRSPLRGLVGSRWARRPPTIGRGQRAARRRLGHRGRGDHRRDRHRAARQPARCAAPPPSSPSSWSRRCWWTTPAARASRRRTTRSTRSTSLDPGIPPAPITEAAVFAAAPPESAEPSPDPVADPGHRPSGDRDPGQTRIPVFDLERLRWWLTDGEVALGRIAVVSVELDNLAQVNERLGYKAGAQLLEAITTRLRAVTRPRDVVAHVNPERFVLVCRDVPDRAAAEALAERISMGVAHPSLVGRRVRRGDRQHRRRPLLRRPRTARERARSRAHRREPRARPRRRVHRDLRGACPRRPSPTTSSPARWHAASCCSTTCRS